MLHATRNCMFDPKKFETRATTLQDKNGKTIQAEVTITKRPCEKWEIDNPFQMAKMIRALDPNDPHFELKVANLFKGFEHAVKGDECRAALFRTRHFTKPEEFWKFFEDRAEGHGSSGRNWFSRKLDGLRLRHWYQYFYDSPGAKECTRIVETPGGEYERECRCWEIEDAYKD